MSTPFRGVFKQGSIAGCAVAVDAAIGLDVEEAGRAVRSDPLRLARRRFSAAEAAALESAQAPGALGPLQCTLGLSAP